MMNKVYLYIYNFLYRTAQNLIEFFLKKNPFVKNLKFYINNI